MLALLALDGRIVTADDCQKATARTILERGGAYILALKGNQRALFEDVRLWLDDPATVPDDYRRRIRSTATTAASRPRRAMVTTPPGPNATTSLASRRSPRSPPRASIDRKTTTATRYYLLSQPLGAARLAESCAAIGRSRRLHWVLDVVMDEDGARARKDHAPGKPRRLRRFALNLLRTHRDHGSTRGKIKRAGWGRRFPASHPHRRLMPWASGAAGLSKRAGD